MQKKEILLTLAKEVILPTVETLKDKLHISTKESLELIKKLDLPKVALIPFSKKIDEDEVIKRFLYLEEIYKLGLKREDVVSILDEFYSSLKKFMKKYKINDVKLFDIMCEALIKYHIDEELLKIYQKEDDFFDFDSEQDQNIEKMHYTDEQKITAKDFMSESTIDDDDIREIEDLLNEYHNLSCHELDENYIEKFIAIIEDFISLFNYSVEFKDLAYALTSLKNLLHGVEITQNKELIKLLLDSVMEDLEKFYYSVFVNQNAVDIHYLDASLVANISQIEIILNQSKGE